jgi:hypothetical protein
MTPSPSPAGWVVTDGNAIDQDRIIAVALARKLDVREIAGDRWGAVGFLTRLQEHGFPGDVDAHVRDSNVTGLAFGLQGGERTNRIFQRHAGSARAADRGRSLQLEPPQASLASGA